MAFRRTICIGLLRRFGTTLKRWSRRRRRELELHRARCSIGPSTAAILLSQRFIGLVRHVGNNGSPILTRQWGIPCLRRLAVPACLSGSCIGIVSKSRMNWPFPTNHLAFVVPPNRSKQIIVGYQTARCTTKLLFVNGSPSWLLGLCDVISANDAALQYMDYLGSNRTVVAETYAQLSQSIKDRLVKIARSPDQ